MQLIEEIYRQQEVIHPTVFDRPKFNPVEAYQFFVIKLTEQLSIRGVKLILHEKNKHVIGQIALWYANDNRFTGDLKKSLFIHGGVGTGKSQLLVALKSLIYEAEQIKAEIIHAVDLQRLYAEKKDDEIQVLKRRKFVMVDDLGTESVEVKNYGNSSEPFNDLFDSRYRNALHTIVTTNLRPSEIGERYGERILDRFRETMNDIVLDFESFRK